MALRRLRDMNVRIPFARYPYTPFTLGELLSDLLGALPYVLAILLLILFTVAGGY